LNAWLVRCRGGVRGESWTHLGVHGVVEITEVSPESEDEGKPKMTVVGYRGSIARGDVE
jgi:hypothetical protein